MSTIKEGFDAAGFYADLKRSVEAQKVNWKVVSKETGVSRTTLSRMAKGRRPDAASLAALSSWAGINPANYVPALPGRLRVERLPARFLSSATSGRGGAPKTRLRA